MKHLQVGVLPQKRHKCRLKKLISVLLSSFIATKNHQIRGVTVLDMQGCRNSWDTHDRIQHGKNPASVSLT